MEKGKEIITGEDFARVYLTVQKIYTNLLEAKLLLKEPQSSQAMYHFNDALARAGALIQKFDGCGDDITENTIQYYKEHIEPTFKFEDN